MLDFANLWGQLGPCLSEWIVTNKNYILYVHVLLSEILWHLLKLSHNKCYTLLSPTNTLTNNFSNIYVWKTAMENWIFKYRNEGNCWWVGQIFGYEIAFLYVLEVGSQIQYMLKCGGWTVKDGEWECFWGWQWCSGIQRKRYHGIRRLMWTYRRYRRRKALKPVPGYGQKKQEDAKISYYPKVSFCLPVLAVFFSFAAAFV